MRRFAKWFLLTMALSTSTAIAQDSTLYSPFTPLPGWHARKVIATTVGGGFLVGSLVSSYYDWWKGTGEPFHFVSEGTFEDYSLGIDKIGHAYTSYCYYWTFKNVLEWGGYEHETAFWWAAGASAFFAISIEIGDGFSPYGFSFEDLAFNLEGSATAYCRQRFPGSATSGSSGHTSRRRGTPGRRTSRIITTRTSTG